jgi:RES domain-containing protein
VAYASGTLSLAALEFFVNLDPRRAADDLRSIHLNIPDDINYREVTTAQLPSSWRDYPAPRELKDVGTGWIQTKSSLLLYVPSVVVPQERNVLINPVHPDFSRCEMGPPEPFGFDARMWKRQR